MTRDTLDFLKRLLDTPGPSGFETAPARVWREEVKTFADQVTADVHGNSVAALNPKGTPRLMLAGHIDEIGLQITHVDDEGYVYFAGIGGWDSQVLVGQRVVISGPKGLVRGVIGKQAVHLMKREDMDKVSKITDLWIDIGAASKAEALERVRLGDAGVLDATVLEFPNDRIVSRSIDNRIGAYVVAEAMRLLAQDRPKHAAVFGVATTREEIAWTGGGARTSAVGLDPTVALVVDVTHSTDWPGAEKKRAGEHKLGGGPVLARGSAVSPVVFDLLVECAEREKIPFSIQAAPHDTGTDADAIYNALRGIPTGLVSVPNRYMHSPNEMVARDDLERAARLLAARLPLDLRDAASGRLAHLAVTVIRQPLQRTQGRRSGREPQRLDRCHPQLARFPPEKPPGRLRPLDERLYRVRASDPAQREDQLPDHRLVLLLFHRDHERHGQRARLTSADPDRHLHPHFLRAVAQRAAQWLGRAPRADLGQRQPHGLSHPLVFMVQALAERRDGIVHPQLSDQLRHVAHHEPLRMLQHVDELVRPLRHVLQGVEHRTPLAHRRCCRQYIHQHLHARGAAALQGRHRGGPVLGRRKQSGEALENRLGVDAPQRDRILPPHAARLRNLLLHARDTGDHAKHLLEASQLGSRRGEVDQGRQEVAHGR